MTQASYFDLFSYLRTKYPHIHWTSRPGILESMHLLSNDKILKKLLPVKQLNMLSVYFFASITLIKTLCVGCGLV